MEHNFTNGDFEDFLKQSADGMRMRPSDKVWEGIASKLHKRRRRFAFATSASAFVLLSSILGYFLINQTKDFSKPLAVVPAEVKDTQNPSSGSSPASAASSAKEVKVIDINTHSSSGIGEKTLGKRKESKAAEANRFPSTLIQAEPQDESITTVNQPFTPTIVDSDPEAYKQEQTPVSSTEESVTEKLLSIESATNLYKPHRKKAEIGLQVFFTPTISYRKLSENRSYLRSVPQTNLITTGRPSVPDVNDAVTHKPDLGLELGLAAKYPLSQNVNVRGGLQFNVNRYGIKAYRYRPEVATIALNGGTDNGVEYVGTVTDYRNFSGDKSKPGWLENLYFQVSAPIGAELRLYSTPKAHFGVAGTVQPAYVMGKKAYLLSSDYKNYSQVLPWLTRRWNVNTAVEAFVSYSTGKMQWQVGPQIRYQLLSSFITEYPLKENLFDFGFKVGVSIKKTTTENPK